MALRPCNAQYCLKALDGILAFCKNHKWPVARPIIARDDQGPGFIIAPFISAGTPVRKTAQETTPVEFIDKNSNVLICGSDLQWRPVPVAHSQASTGTEHMLYAVLIRYNNTALVVAGDHILMLDNGKLITADRLTKDHALKSFNGPAVQIDSVHVGAYKSRFQHISMSDTSVTPDFRKFIATNGVISGDPTMVFFLYDGSLDPFLIEDWKNMPLIGSHKYIKLYGEECLSAPVGLLEYIRVVDELHGVTTSAAGHYFLPAKYSVELIPPDAHSLLPIAEAMEQIENVVGLLSDRILEHHARDLMDVFKKAYRDITFELHWVEELPDGRAAKDPKRVQIFGGLARHMDLEIEGFALMIAHEVGHHVGGGHTSPSGGLHCEGQSDFNAVGIMQTVFPLEFPNMIPSAIEQAVNFFDAFHCPDPPVGVSNCRHPNGCCRIATLRGALELQVEPPPCAV
jgi:hypothetical protein